MSDPERTPTEVVPQINPDGSIRYIPVDAADPDPRVQAQVDAGNTLPITPEVRAALNETRAREDRIAATEDGLSATFGSMGATALNELLLGLPAATDDDLRQRLQDFEEGSPALSGGARLVPWIASAMATGGESVAARALAYAPGGIAARVGLAAEGALGRALASRGLGVGAARGLGRVAGAAAEGTVAGIGESIAEANFRGTPLDAEQILADGAFGAMLGFGAAVPFEGLGAIVRRARRGRTGVDHAFSGADASGTPRRAGEEFVFRRTVPRERAGVLDWNIPGVRDRDLGRLRQARREGIDAWSADAYRDSVASAAEAFQNALNRVDDVFRGGMNRGQRLENTFRGGLADISAESAEIGRDHLRALVEHAEANTVNTALRGRLRAMARTLESDVAGVEDYVRINDALLQEVTDNQAVRDAISSGAERPVAEVLRQAERNLEIVGAGNLAAWHRAYRQRLDSLGPARRFAERIATPDGLGSWRVRVEDLQSTMQGGVGEVVTRETVDELVRLGSQQEALIEATERLMGVSGADARVAMGDAMDLLEFADRYSAIRESAIRAQLDEKSGSGLMAAVGLSGAQAGAAVGGVAFLAGANPLVAGALGLGAAGALTAFSHPVAVQRFLDRLIGSRAATARRMSEGVGRVAGVLRRGGSFSRSAGRVLPPTVAVLRDTQTRERAYREYRDRILELAGNPASLVSSLDDSAGVIGTEISPVLGDTLAMRAHAGVAYLASQLPAADQPSLYDVFEDDDPSLVEMDRWVNMFEAIEDPISILDRLAEGSLEIEHVDAVQAVYPELLAAVRAELAQTVAELSDLPSYQQRMELGTLLGVPVDRSLSGSFVQTMQENWAQTPEQDETQTSRAAFSRTVSMRLADDTHTATQSIQQTLR